MDGLSSDWTPFGRCRMRDNEIFDSANEAEEISELFAQIARIIREKILPEGYQEQDFA